MISVRKYQFAARSCRVASRRPGEIPDREAPIMSEKLKNAEIRRGNNRQRLRTRRRKERENEERRGGREGTGEEGGGGGGERK